MLRRLLCGLTLAAAAGGLGCRVLDRESYSIVIRKNAHLYERFPKPAPEVETPPAPEATDGEPKDPMPDLSQYVRHDLDDLIERAAPPLAPFRPFAYCRLHRTRHPVESVFAYALAPVDYPVALSSQWAYMAIDTTIQAILTLPQIFFGPPDAPLRMEERRRPSR